MATDWTALRVEYVNGSMQYYVYELIDPRDGQVFYVGKGTGDRLNDHLREFLRAGTPSGAKQERIAAIVAAGMIPKALIIERFEDEQAALDAEERRIEHYGIENLTNVLRKGALSSDPIRFTLETGCRLLAEAEAMLAQDLPARHKTFWRESASIAAALIRQAHIVGEKIGRTYQNDIGDGAFCKTTP